MRYFKKHRLVPEASCRACVLCLAQSLAMYFRLNESLDRGEIAQDSGSPLSNGCPQALLTTAAPRRALTLQLARTIHLVLMTAVAAAGAALTLVL